MSGFWRSRSRIWVPGLVLLALNLVGLTAHQLVYAGRAEAREQRFDRSAARLAELERQRQTLEAYLARANRSEEQVRAFFGERLGPEAARLTAILAEVKSLARTAGLEPSTISYRSEEIEDFGLRKRSIVFTVSGSYLDLRKLINLLELSDSFITLEQISLSENDFGEAELRINLQLSVLFAEATAMEASG